jgi:hypothetical protein
MPLAAPEEPPTDIPGYIKWLSEKHGMPPVAIVRSHYTAVTNQLKLRMEESVFWQRLIGDLKTYDEEFLLATGYPLLLPEWKPQVLVKAFEPFLLKTFRKNVLENEHWPDAPKEGWILPATWFSQVNDVVRTLLVVKFLDGVEFLIDKIRKCCEDDKHDCSVHLEAKEEGYYAAHLYTRRQFEIPRITFDTEQVAVQVELQITTQLQEVIRKLLHRYYEDRRKKGPTEESAKWQWNYKSDEFVANYLGHILHYVEGMIMEVRAAQRQEMKV